MRKSHLENWMFNYDQIFTSLSFKISLIAPRNVCDPEPTNLPDCYSLRFFLNFRKNTPKNTTKAENIPGLLQKMSKKCNSPGIFSFSIFWHIFSKIE